MEDLSFTEPFRQHLIYNFWATTWLWWGNLGIWKLIQSTLGFETLDKAAALGLETATPLTDPRQYINSNLGFRNLKIWLLYSKIAAVVVSKSSGNKNKCAVYRETFEWGLLSLLNCRWWVAYFNNQQSLQKIHVVKSFFSFRIVSVFVFVPAGFSNHYGRYFTI